MYEPKSYPGLGLPLRHYPQEFGAFFPMGAHNNCNFSKSALLPVREVAMMAIMDRLMDKPDWHRKVFDDAIVARWRDEALRYPDDVLWEAATVDKRIVPMPFKQIVTDKMVDCCMQELRNKAQYFEATGIAVTLDCSASIAKSDRLIDSQLHVEVLHAFDRLLSDQAEVPDWHPSSGMSVRNLVHPSLYPLVYEETKVLVDEVVGVNNAIDAFAGKGETITNQAHISAGQTSGQSRVPPVFWSSRYQWLPANAEIRKDGGIRFTSYINNLHPRKYPEIYSAIEKLVEKAIPMWEQVLACPIDHSKTTAAGRTTSRFSLPDNCDDDNEDLWTIPQEVQAKLDKARRAAERERDDPAERDDADSDDDDASLDLEDSDSGFDGDPYDFLRDSREPVVPEPNSFKEVNYAPTKSLAESFSKSGLQIIVKMASTELTPENPESPAGSWHVEGQMNEQICATALYYVDSENITTSSLSFRMQTSKYLHDERPYGVYQDSYNWLERVHGTSLGIDGECLQNYGSVETPQGRLLAFPNVFQHSVSPFRLVDPTKPGHRRFIALWLVDPHKRIISTANVPPQQRDWWLESILGSSPASRDAALSRMPPDLIHALREKGVFTEDCGNDLAAARKLPPELMNMVMQNFDAPGMAHDDALGHREELMEERTAFQRDASSKWKRTTYNFCEH